MVWFENEHEALWTIAKNVNWWSLTFYSELQWVQAKINLTILIEKVSPKIEDKNPFNQQTTGTSFNLFVISLPWNMKFKCKQNNAIGRTTRFAINRMKSVGRSFALFQHIINPTIVIKEDYLDKPEHFSHIIERLIFKKKEKEEEECTCVTLKCFLIRNINVRIILLATASTPLFVYFVKIIKYGFRFGIKRDLFNANSSRNSWILSENTVVVFAIHWACVCLCYEMCTRHWLHANKSWHTSLCFCGKTKSPSIVIARSYCSLIKPTDFGMEIGFPVSSKYRFYWIIIDVRHACSL